MSLYVNNKSYVSNIVIDKGLNNVNIERSDIRPGKISIDNKGNKLVSLTNEQFLENNTIGNVQPIDVTSGKTIYVNGERIIGTAPIINSKNELIHGVIKTYSIATSNTIVAGDFVSIVNDFIYKYTGTYNIHGIAMHGGTSGDVIEVVVPN